MAKKFYPIYIFLLSPLFIEAQNIATSSKFSVHNVSTGLYNYSSNSPANKKTTYCGVVYNAQWVKGDIGKPASITIGGNYINERIHLKLRLDENIPITQDLQKLLEGKELCLTGTMINDRTQPELWLDTESVNQLLQDATKAQPKVDTTSTLQGKELKLLNNAYLLHGPKWKAQVVTHLKAGSVVIAEEIHSRWTYAKVVIKAGEMNNVEEFAGFLYNETLGLDKKGRLVNNQ